MLTYKIYLCFSLLTFSVTLPVIRGTSNNNNMAALRETYAELHEMRSLATSVKMIGLTASSTRKTITKILMMENPHVIYENSGKMNIAYSVQYKEKEKSVEDEDYFQWLVN